MQKTKLVTAYWMDIQGPPYYGMTPARKDRYLGSLRSHCQGFNCEIVCYTHAASYNEVKDLKDTYNLDNLTIKIRELSEIRCHETVNKFRAKGPILEQFPELDGRTPEVMWGKFEVLELEMQEDVDFIYWVDVGLQNPHIFPWMYCPHHTKPNFNAVPLDQWNFSLLFNQAIVDKANEITADSKILTLVCTDRQNAYYEANGHTFRFSTWPIAGFFGGAREAVKEYCRLYWHWADRHVEKGILCVEQSIMKYANDFIAPERLIEFTFQTHQNGTRDLDYHYELWQSYGQHGLKPLYTVWHDILNYNNG